MHTAYMREYHYIPAYAVTASTMIHNCTIARVRVTISISCWTHCSIVN